jgi:hypothetical protein
LWHTHILEKLSRIVNQRRRGLFAACNSQKQERRPCLTGAPKKNPRSVSVSVNSESDFHPELVGVVISPAYLAICTRSLFAGAAIGMISLLHKTGGYPGYLPAARN